MTRRFSAAMPMTTRPCTGRSAKKFGNNVYFVTHTWMGAGADPEMEKFIELYTQMHGKAPDTSFVSTGWDTIMLIAEAIKRDRSPTARPWPRLWRTASSSF